jgi:hypothetical protein
MMTTTEHQAQTEPAPNRADRGRSRSIEWIAAIAAVLALAGLAAGCGGSNKPGAAGSTGGVYARFVAYARCMRSHGIPDFPDPSPSPGGGVAFQMNGGAGSDLDKRNPRFVTAEQDCRALLPGAGQSPPPLSPQKIAAEVRWARCMRAHGLPGFPDPNSQGAFDSSRFDESSPAFRHASTVCKSAQPAGPTPVVPGRG